MIGISVMKELINCHWGIYDPIKHHIQILFFSIKSFAVIHEVLLVHQLI